MEIPHMPLCPPSGGVGTAFPSAGYAGILTGERL